MNKTTPNTAVLSTIPVYFCEEMVSDPGSFSPSAGKPKLALQSWVKLGLALDVRTPVPVTVAELERAHDGEFVRDVLACTTPNGFGTCDEAVARSLPWTSGALLCAAREAIANRRVAVAPVSGFHHAGHGHAGGYCTFNGLMVTATALLAEGQAKKVGILDFDQHWGDGTQDIIATLGLEDRITHHSPVRLFSTKSKAVAFLQAIPDIVGKFKGCDVVLYQAGADPHVDDPLGGWLTTEQLFERDRLVFQAAAALGLPIAWNLAGGYQTPVRKVLDIHDNTLRACCATFLAADVAPTVHTLLSLAAEGGGLNIFGAKKAQQWRFQAVTHDHTPTLINEDAICETHGWVDSLPEALAQIEYPWNCFLPLEVHPEFAAEILQLKLAKDGTGHFYDRVTPRWEQCVAKALNLGNPPHGANKGANESSRRIDMRTLKVIATSGAKTVLWATGGSPQGKALVKGDGSRPTRLDMEQAASRSSLIAQLNLDEWSWRPQKPIPSATATAHAPG